MRVLQIRQPYAWLVSIGAHDVIPTARPSSYRGPVLLYASNRRSPVPSWFAAAYYSIMGERLPKRYNLEHGGIVGFAEIYDVVRVSNAPPPDSIFSAMPGYKVRGAQPLAFQACHPHDIGYNPGSMEDLLRAAQTFRLCPQASLNAAPGCVGI